MRKAITRFQWFWNEVGYKAIGLDSQIPSPQKVLGKVFKCPQINM